MRIVHHKALLGHGSCPVRKHHTRRKGLDQLTGLILQRCLHTHRAGTLIEVLDLGIDNHLGTLIGDLVEMDKDTSSGHPIGCHGIRQTHLRTTNEPYIAVDTAMIGKVERILRFSGRIGLIVRVVRLDSYHATISGLHPRLREREHHRQIASQVLLDKLTVHIEGLLAHHRLEVQQHLLLGTIGRHGKGLAIPDNALVVAATTRLGRDQFDRMRGRDHLPGRIVERNSLGSGHIALHKAPAAIEIIDYTPTPLERNESRHRGLGRTILLGLHRYGK